MRWTFGSSAGTNILATGIQNLAALVSIFALDSTEPYAFNYGQGWVSPMASTLSWLGILGYIRGLVNLGLEWEGCQKAGFDIIAERKLLENDAQPCVEGLEQ